MNETRRKAISVTLDKIIKAQELLEDIQSDIDCVSFNEQMARDNIPERLQATERYEKCDAACDNLDTAANSIDDALQSLQEVSDALEYASE
jgi:hypothetical protein